MPDDTAKLRTHSLTEMCRYIVTIPKDFKVSCLGEHQALPVSKIPATQTGITSINRSTPI